MLEHLEVGVARVGHVLAQLVDHGASPAGEVVGESHEAGRS